MLVSRKQPISCGEYGVKLGREISVEGLYQIEGLRTKPVPGLPIEA